MEVSKNILSTKSMELNQLTLIEASAGTGKTYAMVGIYLRLLLEFAGGLPVDKILLVTFTEAATAELKHRVLTKISQARSCFSQILAAKQQFGATDFCDFSEDLQLQEIYDLYKDDLENCILRLKIAEQNMDRAAIYTIHGFCNKILNSFPFESGIGFNLSLAQDVSALKLEAARSLWRKNFYALDYDNVYKIIKDLISPVKMLEKIQKIRLDPTAKPLTVSQVINDNLHLKQDFFTFIRQNSTQFLNFLDEVLENELHSKIILNQNRIDNFRKFFQNPTIENLEDINDAYTALDQEKLFKKNCLAKLSSDNFAFIEWFFPKLRTEFEQINQQQLNFSDALLQACKAEHLAIFNQLKQQQQVMDFDDLIHLLYLALGSNDSKSQYFSLKIRELYPFAMIDEFQDTDFKQYSIFKKIYFDNVNSDGYRAYPNSGFIAIGDPKQAIYGFRGASIETYLNASHDVNAKFCLNTNYRSDKQLVETLNQLYLEQQVANPFEVDGIEYEKVEGKKDLQLGSDIQKLNKIQVFSCELIEPNDFNDLFKAKLCAYEIAKILKDGDINLYEGDTKTPLSGKDIAILVESGKQAKLIRNELSKYNINAIYTSERDNIFSTSEASQIYQILVAVLNPNDNYKLINALASEIFAQDINALIEFQHNENLWDKLSDEFSSYQEIWRRQGILPMLQSLFNQRSIAKNLACKNEKERILSNLLQLAELLQQQALKLKTEYELIKWLERKIAAVLDNSDNSVGDEELRLETEQDLVKISTLHKSKGLEYNLVWLPFGVNCKINKRDDKNLSEQQERSRLAYVGLTRAKYQINLFLAKDLTPPIKKVNAHEYSKKIENLIKGNLETDDLASIIQQRFPEQDKQISLIFSDYSLDETAQQQLFSKLKFESENTTKLPQIQPYTGKIDNSWIISSFTGLNHYNNYNNNSKKELDLNSKFEDELQLENNLNEYEQLYLDNASQHMLVKGVQFGKLLHAFFETYFNQRDFNASCEQFTQSLRNFYAIYLGADKTDEDLLTPRLEQILQTWLNAVLQQKLTPQQFNLQQISQGRFKVEMEFYLALANRLNITKFNQLVAKYLPYRKDKPFSFHSIKGMLKGFIDLWFCVDSKYYIIDYKSNYLGESYENYNFVSMQQEMIKHNYDLQYIIYCWALNRYLQQKISDYDYQRDFGGVFYLFVRGMGETNATTNDDKGVYFQRLDPQFMLDLEQL